MMLILSPNSQHDAPFKDFFFFLLCLKVGSLKSGSLIKSQTALISNPNRLDFYKLRVMLFRFKSVTKLFWFGSFTLQRRLEACRAAFPPPYMLCIVQFDCNQQKKKHLPSCVCIASNEWCVSGGVEPMSPDEINNADWLEDNQAPCLEVTVSLTATSPRCVFCFNGSQMGRFPVTFGFFSRQRRCVKRYQKRGKTGKDDWSWWCEIEAGVRYPSLLIKVAARARGFLFGRPTPQHDDRC